MSIAQGQDRHGHGRRGGDRRRRRRCLRRGGPSDEAALAAGQAGREQGRREARRRAAREDDPRREAPAGAAALRRPDQRRRREKAGVGGCSASSTPTRINELQHVAVEQSRLGIPILFAYDTIHGYRTIFPIPLGAGSCVRPERRLRGPQVRRARVRRGRPQADLQPDGRRLARAALGPDLRGRRRGPVPELRDRRRAREGRAGPRLLARQDKVVTSVKHYAAYGQPEAGRDYNTTDMSEQRLRNLYLPPFKAAVDAGADTAMCSFNAINGVPGCANKRLETDILKKEWGFDGFIESDYTAVAELLNHGTAATLAADGPTRAGAQRRHRLRDGLDVHPRQRQAAAHGRQDLDGAPRRRRAPDPAREVPRRAVRQPLRRPGQGRGRAGAPRRLAPRRARPPGARWSCSRTTARRCRSTRARRRP